MKKLILLLSFFLLLVSLQAQNDVSEISSGFAGDNRVFFELGLRQGFYVPFSSRHQYTRHYSLYGLDLCIGRQTDGSETWEKLFNYPSYGLMFRYEHNTLDSVKYEHRNEDGQAITDWVALGNCYTLAGFLDGHFYNGKKWSFDYGFTFGLSFWPYYGNEFIGSPIDAHLAFKTGLTLRVSNNLDLYLRLLFSHSSDGALKLPNYGTNVLSSNIGLRYYPKDRPTIKAKEPETWCPTWALNVSNAFGLLQTNTRLQGKLPSEMPYYTADYIQVGFTHHFHPKYRYSFGLDLGYTGETKIKYEQAYLRSIGDPYEECALETSLEEFRFSKAMHLAAHSSFEVQYSKLTVCLGFGYYLSHGIYLGTDEKKTWGLTESSMTPFELQYLPTDYRNFYGRLGLKYYFGRDNKYYAGMFVKAHGSVDYIEWTLGTHLFQHKGKNKKLE